MPVGGAGGRSKTRPRPTGRAPSTLAPPSRKRQTIRPRGRAALGAISPTHPSAQSWLSYFLVRRPRRSTGLRSCQTHTRQTSRRGQIRDPDVDVPLPETARQLLVGRNPELGKVAVPLGPRRVVRIREIEGVDDVAALPAAVGWRITVRPRRPARTALSHPATADGPGIDVERQGLDGPRVLELADESGDAPVFAAANQIDRFLVVQRLDRLRHPNRDVLRTHDPLEALHNRPEFRDPIGTSSTRLTPLTQPPAHSARRRTRRLRNDAVAQVPSPVNPYGFVCESGTHKLNCSRFTSSESSDFRRKFDASSSMLARGVLLCGILESDRRNR